MQAMEDFKVPFHAKQQCQIALSSSVFLTFH